MDGSVGALAVFDDGGGPTLYAGGLFTTAGGVAAAKIAKWDGVGWTPLGGGLTGGGPTAHCDCLAVFDNGTGAALYAGGVFDTAGSVPANFIAKWDGTSWSSLGSGVNGQVIDMVVFDDGSGEALYVAGTFTVAGGLSARRVARWNGSSWSALGTGTNNAVRALEVFDDGTIAGAALYAGGLFTTAGGVGANRIAKWSGSSWGALGGGTNGAVNTLAVYDDGGGAALHVGGTFTTAGGVAASNIARWDGASWNPLGSGTSGTVAELGVYDDGGGAALFAGGLFTTAGGVGASSIARWDGTSWSALGAGLSGGSISSPDALGVFDDGCGEALYVGGPFTSAGGLAAEHLAKWRRPDLAPPTLACPPFVFMLDDSTPGEVVSFSVQAIDCEDPAPAVVCVPASGSFFPRGLTLVTCTATDAAGNQALRTFPVIVMTRHTRPRP